VPVTSGQGNPKWTRDETILALDLYLRTRPSVPSDTHPEVIALSELLRALPIHPRRDRNETFRNPSGVAFKLQNLHSVATGKGLANASQMDQEVWAEFGSNPNDLFTLAEAIRFAAKEDLGDVETEDEDDALDFEFREGRVLYVYHRKRERNAGVRKAALENSRRSSNGLHCAACSKKADAALGAAGEAIFEVHHIRPLSAVGEATTRPSDLTVLCANCHRLIHRLSRLEKTWFDIRTFADRINSNGTG
jgi:5-methylcytosine-specific restriction enzyme A